MAGTDATLNPTAPVAVFFYPFGSAQKMKPEGDAARLGTVADKSP